jgi:adenylate cyclase
MLAALSLGCTALCAGFVGIRWEWLHQVETYTEDLRLQVGRKTPPDPRLVFVGIGKGSYAEDYPPGKTTTDHATELISGRFPWSREVWAIAMERLLQTGAKAVALDLVLSGPGEGDEALMRVLNTYSNRVVVGAAYTSLDSDRGGNETLVFPSPTVLTRPPGGHPASDPRVGHVTMVPDLDDVVRFTHFRAQGGVEKVLPEGVVMESLAARLLRQSGYPDAIPPGYEPRRFRYASAPGQAFLQLDLAQIMEHNTWEQTYRRSRFFKDKIVIIGPAADIFHDEHRTPFSKNMLGPEIHLNILSAAFAGEFLREANLPTNVALTLWGGLVAWLLSWRFQRLFQRFSVGVLCVILYLLTAYLLYDHANLFVAAVAPCIALLSSLVTGLVYDFALARHEKAELRRTLERYVAKDVVRELIDNPQTYLKSLTGVRKPVTIFFSDVRGFTTMTEGMNASVLVQQLNEYFQEMVSIVVNNRGRLDKFIGDAVMADWGSFVSGGLATDAGRAVLSALQMREALEQLNARWSAEGMKTMAFGIGINHGEVVVGNLGSEEKMEVSVIGDPVNLASRLESLTKAYHLDLLLGESVATLVRNQFTLRTVDLVKVVGKTHPVEVFTVPPEAGKGSTRLEWLEDYEQGVALYRKRQFAEALVLFRKAAQAKPDDFLISLYQERCETLAGTPPEPGWTGVMEMTRK